jgi:hypothetical protein
VEENEKRLGYAFSLQGDHCPIGKIKTNKSKPRLS